MDAPETPEVTHNEAEHQFECAVDSLVAKLEYERENGVVRFTHTRVPKELEGRGIAGRLVARGFEDARRRGLKVVPECSYVAAYVKRHPELAELVEA